MNEKQLKPKLMPLPCPFCGAEPSLAPENPDKEGGAWGMVYCNNKECGVKPKVNDGIREADERGTGAYIDLAILRWNKRNAELGWPLDINKEMDDHAFRSGLSHWSCTSKKSNVYWVRRDGFVHVVTFKENGGYPAELRKTDIENSIGEFVF